MNDEVLEETFYEPKILKRYYMDVTEVQTLLDAIERYKTAKRNAKWLRKHHEASMFWGEEEVDGAKDAILQAVLGLEIVEE